MCIRDSWDSYRRARNCRAWTQHAEELSLRTLERLRDDGHDPSAVIEQAIERGWTGLFPLRDAGGGGKAEERDARFAAAAAGIPPVYFPPVPEPACPAYDFEGEAVELDGAAA